MPYYLIIALLLVCTYHVYKTPNSTYWYFIILFIPIFGCIIYIVSQMILLQHLEIIQKGIIRPFKPFKKIKDLEQHVVLADTFQNDLLRAGGYAEIHAFAKAKTTNMTIPNRRLHLETFVRINAIFGELNTSS